MSEKERDELMDDLPESNIQPLSTFSIVWLVPLVAAFIGAWIGYRAWSEMGPTISITFNTAEGLDAGKTKIKYKNVEIGKVISIHINPETEDVKVMAEMTRDIKPFLTDQTEFWVVRARVNARGVSDLSTLLSGAYIGIGPSSKGNEKRNFKGLEVPPVITGSIPGKHFVLHTKNLGSLERDTPVYYRKFDVGLVEDVKLNDDGESITIRIFINAPYDQWVNNTTRFWNSSGIDFSMSADGIKMNTESLVSILIGGIAFESSDLSTNVTQAENNTPFKLYANQADSLKKDYDLGFEYVLNFSESVRGLTVGAPVDFRGIQLGEVTDIHLSYDTEQKKISVPVNFTLDYGRVVIKGDSERHGSIEDTHRNRAEYLVKQGLRAQLQTGNLLTGQLYVSLDFFPDAKPFVMDWNAKTPEFPSVPGTFDDLKSNINSILKRSDALLSQLTELSYKLNHDFAPDLSATLKQAENTLLTIQNTLTEDSPLQQDLKITLREFSKAARSIKSLTDYLERHPESLIRGKKETNGD
ncbi:MAG: intermembrane transport protein PqiB [Methylococcaceae bacterium]